jgi:hypothetical protein
MMKVHLLGLCLAALPMLAAAGEDARLEEGRALAGALGAQLKAELMTAMQADGPVAAIEVCHVEAPRIAARLSGDGATVGRTALKVRNPANAPTAGQAAVMTDFAKRMRRGETDAPPEAFDVAADGSARYMRAIPTGAPCLACHGSDIAPAVQARLDALYPQDAATGFRAGELRGAFVVAWPARPPAP